MANPKLARGLALTVLLPTASQMHPSLASLLVLGLNAFLLFLLTAL